MGYFLVSIPYWEWGGCGEGSQERVRYLNDQLLAIPPSLSFSLPHSPPLQVSAVAKQLT
jgi:hypothetical protein